MTPTEHNRKRIQARRRRRRRGGRIPLLPYSRPKPCARHLL